MNNKYIQLIPRVMGRLLPLLVLILIGSELLAQVPAIASFNQSWIDAHTRDSGLQGIINYILVSCLLASVGVPRQFIAFLGGYAFGFAEGLFYSTIAITCSCLLSMSFSRFYAKPLVIRYFPSKVLGLNRFLTEQIFIKAIIIRLLPVGNNLVTNVAAGVTTIKLWPFVLGSMFGYVPQMAIFALMGKGVVVQSYWKIIFSVVFLAVSSLLSLYLYKKFKTAKYLNTMSADTDTDTDTERTTSLSTSNGLK